MRYDEIDMQGHLLVEEVASLPSWDSAYTRRIIYVNSTGQGSDTGDFYFGGEAGWLRCAQGNKDNFLKSNEADTHSGTITPGTDNTIDLGAGSYRYANIYGVSFQGTTTTATYADLAEKYTAPVKYPAGTVVRISENAKYEVESADAYDEDIIGVVSEKPAFVMNSESLGQMIGLIGKLPVRIRGTIKKGDPIMAWKEGTAIACKPELMTDLEIDPRLAISMLKIGYALESKKTDIEKLVMCILKK